MSFAIQALAYLPAEASLPVTSPTELPAALSHHVEKPVAFKNIVTTEFQQGMRNARIQLLVNGEYSILCFDASTDYNELLMRQSVQTAMEAAEAWVNRKL